MRLRAGAELLARAAAGEQPLSPAQVAAAVRDFVAQFERHLRKEEDLLASGRPPQGVPGTVNLGGHSHEWYPLTITPESHRHQNGQPGKKDTRDGSMSTPRSPN